MSKKFGLSEIVLIPAIITLLVTILRLVGELMGWSKLLFNSEAGGGAALVGITWLVPVFGIYFAWKLASAGQREGAKAGRTIGLALLALVIVFGVGMVGFAILGQTSLWALGVFSLASIAVLPLVGKGWKALYRTLLEYGLAARIPVAVLMLFAIAGDWGTHYDLPPPDFPQMSWFLKWVLIGLLPQMTIWISFTVIVGAIFGGLTLLFVRSK